MRLLAKWGDDSSFVKKEEEVLRGSRRHGDITGHKIVSRSFGFLEGRGWASRDIESVIIKSESVTEQ